MSDDQIKEILKNSKTIAMIGIPNTLASLTAVTSRFAYQILESSGKKSEETPVVEAKTEETPVVEAK